MSSISQVLIWLVVVVINLKFLNSVMVSDGKIGFTLFNNKTTGEKIHLGKYGNCTNGNLKVLVHGWLDLGVAKKNPQQPFWYQGVQESYVALNCNVITVNWETYNNVSHINSAMSIAEKVGSVVGRTVNEFAKACKIPLKNIHLIGHSLGAHVIGFAGKEIKQSTKKKIFRLTGLDPAGAAYKHASSSEKFSKDHATHVDTVVISDGLCQGMNSSLGHVNFRIHSGITFTSFFSHYLAPMMFQETINKTKYEGVKCNNSFKFEKGECQENTKNFLGEKVDFGKPGDFYLRVSYDAIVKTFAKKDSSGNWTEQ